MALSPVIRVTARVPASLAGRCIAAYIGSVECPRWEEDDPNNPDTAAWLAELPKSKRAAQDMVRTQIMLYGTDGQREDVNALVQERAAALWREWCYE